MPYHIIGGKETLLLAQARPDSMQQLRRVPGISDHQLKQYGKQILTAVQQVCSELSLSTNQPLLEELQRVEPKAALQVLPKGQPEGLSKAESEVHQLYQSGLTVQQIAQQPFTWKVSVTAVQGKLADCIKKGADIEWNLQRLALDTTKLQAIEQAIAAAGSNPLDVTMKLKPVFDQLPEGTSTDAYNEMRLLLSKMRFDAVHSTVLPSYALSIPTAQQQPQQQPQQQQPQQQHSAVTKQQREAYVEASIASFDRMIAAADTMRRIDCSTAAGVAQKQAALQQLEQMQAPLLAQCASALGLSPQQQQSHSNGAASMLANIAASTGTVVAAGNATVAAATALNAAITSVSGGVSSSKKRQLPQMPLPYSTQSVNRGSKSAKYGPTTTNNSNSSMSQSSTAGGSSLYTPSYNNSNNKNSNTSYGNNSTAAATSSASRALQPLQPANTTAVSTVAVTKASLAPLIQSMFSGNKGVTIADIMSSVPQLAQQQQQQKTSAVRIVQEVLQDMQQEFSIYMRDGAYYAF
eukprot:2561-Heterococcus_DN1.PRE.6